MNSAVQLNLPVVPPPLDGLKVIAAFIETLAEQHQIHLRAMNEMVVWRWARRRLDPLPTYRRPRSAGRLADPEAVTLWFRRQRFTLASDVDSRG